MTFIANAWMSFILALYKPFVKLREDKMKLQHTIDTDKADQQQRHIETLMESQKETIEALRDVMQDNNSVIKDWLEGFHRIPTGTPKAPRVNDDARMYELEMEALALDIGKRNMTSMQMDALIRNGFDDLLVKAL